MIQMMKHSSVPSAAVPVHQLNMYRIFCAPKNVQWELNEHGDEQYIYILYIFRKKLSDSQSCGHRCVDEVPTCGTEIRWVTECSVFIFKNTYSGPLHLQSESVNVLRHSKCIAWGAFSQLYCVVGRKQPAFPPQPPFPPRRVRAIQHFDDVSDAETELVVFLCGEAIQRFHLHRGWPLWDGGQKPDTHQYLSLTVLKRKILLYQF